MKFYCFSEEWNKFEWSGKTKERAKAQNEAIKKLSEANNFWLNQVKKRIKEIADSLFQKLESSYVKNLDPYNYNHVFIAYLMVNFGFREANYIHFSIDWEI